MKRGREGEDEAGDVKRRRTPLPIPFLDAGAPLVEVTKGFRARESLIWREVSHRLDCASRFSLRAALGFRDGVGVSTGLFTAEEVQTWSDERRKRWLPHACIVLSARPGYTVPDLFSPPTPPAPSEERRCATPWNIHGAREVVVTHAGRTVDAPSTTTELRVEDLAFVEETLDAVVVPERCKRLFLLCPTRYIFANDETLDLLVVSIKEATNIAFLQQKARKLVIYNTTLAHNFGGIEWPGGVEEIVLDGVQHCRCCIWRRGIERVRIPAGVRKLSLRFYSFFTPNMFADATDVKELELVNTYGTLFEYPRNLEVLRNRKRGRYPRYLSFSETCHTLPDTLKVIDIEYAMFYFHHIPKSLKLFRMDMCITTTPDFVEKLKAKGDVTV